MKQTKFFSFGQLLLFIGLSATVLPASSSVIIDELAYELNETDKTASVVSDASYKI